MISGKDTASSLVSRGRVCFDQRAGEAKDVTDVPQGISSEWSHKLSLEVVIVDLSIIKASFKFIYSLMSQDPRSRKVHSLSLEA